MQKNIKIPLFLLYFFFLFPLVLSIILNAPPSSVLTSGSLSVRNYGEIFALFLCGTYILLNSRFIIENYFKNKLLRPFFLLASLYYISTLWSEYKIFTLFRTTEFFFIGIIALITYNNLATENKKLDLSGVRKYLFHIVIIGILYSFLMRYAFSGIVISRNFLADNAISLSIVGSLLICFFHNFFLKDKNKILYFFLFSFFFLSYSLTAILSLAICLIYLYLSKFNNNSKNFYLIIIIILLIFYFFIGGSRIVDEILAFVSSRPIDRISHLTGREKIWELIFFELKDNFLGSGFATDMYILLDNYNRNIIGKISSGHNTYLEGYIAAKWLGVGIILYSFYFWFKNSQKFFPKKYSPLIQSLIFFAIISGFTTSGYGGSLVSNPYILFWVTFTPLVIFKNNDQPN
tara:strand:- start:303 stop:1514 length:1212 start_codon:yes stop_codon:yes gene_type:complete